MQFQVPQFIETQDKIVGPFSLVQFGYLAGAGFIVVILYIIVPVQFVWFGLSAIIMGVAFGLAFIKINGQPIIKIIGAALSFYWNPQTYVWLPENPSLPKDADSLRALAGRGISFESLISGVALKNTWKALQTGGPLAAAKQEQTIRYEILRRTTGERQAARRVDYTK